MCMSGPSAPPPPPPPPSAPPVLEQIAPKSASSKSESEIRKKSKGFSRYRTDNMSARKKSATGSNKLGGIPTKTGV